MRSWIGAALTAWTTSSPVITATSERCRGWRLPPRA
jgi:hypothetical protein